MNASRFTSRTIATVMSLVIALSLVACDKEESGTINHSHAAQSSGSSTPKWEGKYINTKENMTLTLMADHRGIMDSDTGTPADVTWSVNGDKMTMTLMSIPTDFFMTSDGNLRDSDGAVWTRAN